MSEAQPPPDDDEPAPALKQPPVESFLVAAEEEGARLDALLAARFTQYSRTHLRKLIDAGDVLIDGRPAVKVSYKLLAGQRVEFVLPEIPREGSRAENIPLSLLYEDESLVVIDKPAGMVVHPARGHWRGTLTAALAWHFEHLSSVGGAVRPGIVHRLDRETSGVIVVAKTDSAHLRLAEQFAARTVEKQYFAVVVGMPDRDRDVIDEPLGVHPHQREKMAIRRGHPDSREAVTRYEVLERFTGFAAVQAFPKTGRTHQIRVHLTHAGYPILCDRLYGGRSVITLGEVRKTRDETPLLERLALHAQTLGITHPETGERLEFTAPLPPDLQAVLSELKTHRRR